ncbi:MAG: TolC family protein [Aureispira sp.]
MKKWLGFLYFWSSIVQSLCAQNNIDLPTALKQVRSQHVQLQTQRLYLEQQNALKDAAKGHPAASFGYGFEELGVVGSGVHSLYFNQSFNMPSVAQKRAALQTAIVEAGSSQLLAIELQLERAVSQHYQRILFLKSQEALQTEILTLYDSVVTIAERRASVGETGRLPLLTTQNAQQQLMLQLLQTQQLATASLIDLQLLLYDNTITGIQDSVLQTPSLEITSITPPDHPLVLQVQQQQQILITRRAVLKSQWLPQFDVGVQLQLVEGTFPNTAGQIGWTVPLFKKGLKAQLKGNDLGQQQLALQAVALTQTIKLKQKKAALQIYSLQQQVLYLEQEVLPTLLLQQHLLQRAYALGEIDYLSVLQSLQQVLNTRQQYLEWLLKLHLQWIDYQYWSS